MVCAGVEGGGTDSCEVRAKWGLWVKAPTRAVWEGMESNLSLVPSVGLDSASHSWGPGLALLGCVESRVGLDGFGVMLGFPRVRLVWGFTEMRSSD